MIDGDTLVCVLSEYKIKSRYCHTLKGINEWSTSPSLPTKSANATPLPITLLTLAPVHTAKPSAYCYKLNS